MAGAANVSFSYYQIALSVSFVVCFLTHHVISPWIFKNYSFYSKLTKNKRMEWDSSYESFMGTLAMSISFGYFLCDSISMPIYWRGYQLFLFLIHHGAAMAGIYGLLIFRGCSFFGVFRLITELSTPFANQRWFFRTAGINSTRRRTALSTIIFTILFIITRNGLIIPYWITSLKSFNSEGMSQAKKRLPYMHWVCYGVPGALDILNIYWSKDVYSVGWRALKYFKNADWQHDLNKAKDRVRKIKASISNFKPHEDDGDSADERFFTRSRSRIYKLYKYGFERSASAHSRKRGSNSRNESLSNLSNADEYSDYDETNYFKAKDD